MFSLFTLIENDNIYSIPNNSVTFSLEIMLGIIFRKNALISIYKLAVNRLCICMTKGRPNCKQFTAQDAHFDNQLMIKKEN